MNYIELKHLQSVPQQHRPQVLIELYRIETLKKFSANSSEFVLIELYRIETVSRASGGSTPETVLIELYRIETTNRTHKGDDNKGS